MGSKHPLTSSERRGILTLGVLSLLITGLGIGVTYCDRGPSVIEANEVEILLRDGEKSWAADSSEVRRVRRQRDSLRKVSRDSLRKLRRDSLRRKGKLKKTPKTYRRRSRLDERAE